VCGFGLSFVELAKLVIRKLMNDGVVRSGHSKQLMVRTIYHIFTELPIDFKKSITVTKVGFALGI